MLRLRSSYVIVCAARTFSTYQAPHKLLKRLMNRCKSYDEVKENTSIKWKSSVSRFQDMVAMYFKQGPLHLPDDIKDNSQTQPLTQFGSLYKEENLNEFLTWAFFNKHYHELNKDELDELKKCFEVLKNDMNFGISPGKSNLDVIRLNIDDPFILHRPLLFYGTIYCLSFMTSLVLRLYGFRYFVTSNGIKYWFYQVKKGSKIVDPTLFFHGIAPGGYALYLPFFINYWKKFGAGPAFIFDLPYISMKLDFDVLTEDETVDGILEALDRHCHGGDSKMSLVCHSFGTFLATWLNHSIPQRIRKFTLIDPVSVMLSSTGVGQNFNYSYGWGNAFTSISKLIIFTLASTEMGIQHFLRCHFCWYNSELFLDDIHPEADVLILLSMHDDIMFSNVAKDEVDRINLLITNGKMTRKKKIKVLCEDHYNHGDFLLHMKCWNKIVTSIK